MLIAVEPEFNSVLSDYLSIGIVPVAIPDIRFMCGCQSMLRQK